jgi:hypothetical protein
MSWASLLALGLCGLLIDNASANAMSFILLQCAVVPGVSSFRIFSSFAVCP